MTRPWLHHELAIAVGLAMLGEDWEYIARLHGRTEQELADAFVIARDYQIFVRWSQHIERVREHDRAARKAHEAALREAKRLAAIPEPRIVEPDELPGRYVPRQFARVSHIAARPGNLVATLMGDPPACRSALSRKLKGSTYGNYRYTPELVPTRNADPEITDQGGRRKPISRGRQARAYPH